jgi:protein-disulfide isomerase
MAQLHPPVSSNDHIQGSADAAIELVEYGDYQCPYCGQAYPIIKSLQRSLGKKLKFVFRNFPLTEMHPNAMNAALAAEAAALQNKFWEMHDIIYEHQQYLNDASLLAYAEKIGLDLKRFKNDIKESTLTEKVEQDFESGARSGVNGTPSFYVNGKKYNGDWELDAFEEFLRGQLEAV